MKNGINSHKCILADMLVLKHKAYFIPLQGESAAIKAGEAAERIRTEFYRGTYTHAFGWTRKELNAMIMRAAISGAKEGMQELEYRRSLWAGLRGGEN